MKSLVHAAAGAVMLALAAQYTVIDADGNIVGTLITDAPPASQLRVAGLADAARKAPQKDDQRKDRAFHPDYAKALTVDQAVRAWQSELDRLNPPVVTGGG